MWKKDENGNLVADDKGNPILITADGKEEGFSLEANKQHISSINAESASRRKEIDSLKDQLKPFEGLDPTKAREAIEKVKSFSDNFVVDENNRVVALHDPSNPNSIVFSEANAGEPASFDEALAKFVNAYPNKDQILKSSGNQGGGTSAGEYSGSRKWDDYTEAERVHLAKTNPEAFKNLQKTQGK